MTAAGADIVRIIAMQLGREPAIAFTVEISCPYGWPAVIRNEPFTSTRTPHPNLYYLTCPYLVREVSRLEDASVAAKLEERVADSPGIREQLIGAQKEHQLAWLQAAGTHEKTSGMKPPFIAGASSPEHLKCLHAHVAWGLTHTGYEIAEMVLDMIVTPWCTDDYCAQRLSREESS
jgi:hypothetical protein